MVRSPPAVPRQKHRVLRTQLSDVTRLCLHLVLGEKKASGSLKHCAQSNKMRNEEEPGVCACEPWGPALVELRLQPVRPRSLVKVCAFLF